MPFSLPGLNTRENIVAALLVTLALFAGVMAAPQIFNDGDTYWHLAAGDWILAHGVPHSDPFSYTFAGKAWTAHEWLSEVIMALAYGAGGWSGLAVLIALAAAATAFILAAQAGKALNGIHLALALILALGCIAPNLLARPHVLVLPLMAGWTAVLLGARERNAAPHWAWALLMCAWANMHGSFVLGFVLAGAFGLEALMGAQAEKRIDVIKQWALFGIAALIAAMITPHGPAGILFPLQLMGMGSLDNVIEWRAPSFAKIGPLEIALMSTLFVMLYRGVRLPALRLAMLLGLLHMTLQHERHEMVLAIVGLMILARPIADAMPVRETTALSVQGQRRVMAVASAMAVALIAVRFVLPVTRVDAEAAPISAVAQVPAALRDKPVFNGYNFGGYLIFSGVKPFIDGRTDMYGDAFMANYLAAEGGDAKALSATLARYGVQWAILAPSSPAVGLIEAMPGWQRLHGDRYAVVLARTGPGA